MKRLAGPRTLPESSVSSCMSPAGTGMRAPPAGTIRFSAPRPSAPKMKGPMARSPASVRRTRVAAAASPNRVRTLRSKGWMNLE